MMHLTLQCPAPAVRQLCGTGPGHPTGHTERFVPGPCGHGGKKLRNAVRPVTAPFEAREETDHNLPNELSSSLSRD